MSGPSGNREMEVVDLTTSKVKARVYAPAIDTKVYQITMEKSRLRVDLFALLVSTL